MPQAQMEREYHMDLKEIVLEGVDWIDVAEHQGKWQLLVNTVMNGCM